MKNLSIEESKTKRESDSAIPLIDVRTPAEFDGVHAETAVNYPMESLDVEEISFSKEERFM
jgi:rhodanese-related sulfurtransferase